jgi:hypothetical protein
MPVLEEYVIRPRRGRRLSRIDAAAIPPVLELAAAALLCREERRERKQQGKGSRRQGNAQPGFAHEINLRVVNFRSAEKKIRPVACV